MMEKKESIYDVYEKKENSRLKKKDRVFDDHRNHMVAKKRVEDLKVEIERALVEKDEETFYKATEELKEAEAYLEVQKQRHTDIFIESDSDWYTLMTRSSLIYEKLILKEEIDQALDEGDTQGLIHLSDQLNILERELKYLV